MNLTEYLEALEKVAMMRMCGWPEKTIQEWLEAKGFKPKDEPVRDPMNPLTA